MDVDDEKYVIHGPQLLEPIPNESYGKTLCRCLRENYNLPIAAIDVITRKNISHKTVLERSQLLAYCLHKYGIIQEDVIAISSENSLNYIIPLVAGMWLGTTVTLYNPQYTTREILHVANISKPSIIFCSKASLQTILQVKKEFKSLRKVIVIDGFNKEGDVESVENFMTKHSRGYKSFEPIDVDPQQVALLLYSSGTTGLPKGVMLTHYNLNANFVLFRDPRFNVQRLPGTFTGLGLLPFYHAYGFTLLSSNLLYGQTTLVVPKFEKVSFLRAVQDFKLKWLSVVPHVVNFLANSDLVDNYDLSHVEGFSCGGAPLSKYIQEQLFNRLKNVKYILQGYGLTEATVAVVITSPDSQVRGSVGNLLPATSAKVVDVNTGKTLGPSAKGELCFKGPQIMKGYAGDISSTSSTIDKDGWLKTGDIGYYDNDGFFYVVDRIKELIKYKGHQVAPAELEAVLLEHPRIDEAAVIGVPDELAEEVPLAFVVKNNPGLTESDVKQFVAEQVAHYKQLRGGVIFVQEIPKSATGKILRRKLRQALIQKSKL